MSIEIKNERERKLMSEKNLSFNKLVIVFLVTICIGLLSLMIQVEGALAKTNEIELSIQQEEIRTDEEGVITVTDVNQFQEAVYLSIPKGLKVDMSKTNQANESLGVTDSNMIDFNKDKRFVKLVASNSKEEVTNLKLILTGEEGHYELATSNTEVLNGLTSNKIDLTIKGNTILFSPFNHMVEKKERTTFKNSDDEDTINSPQRETRASAGDKLTLEFSQPSKTTLDGEADQVAMTLKPGTTDTANPLYSGKLVIEIGTGLTLSQYTNDLSSSSPIKNYQYSYIDNTLTYEFKDGLSTTTLSQMNFSVNPGILASKSGSTYDIKATFTGKTISGDTYQEKIVSSPIFTVKNVTYTPVTKDNLKFEAPISVSMMPGATREFSTRVQLTNKVPVSFSNFRIKTEALNEQSENHFLTDRRTPITHSGNGNTYNDRNRKVITWKESPSVEFSETGQYSMVDRKDLYYSFTVPKTAVPGSQYKYQVSYYDGEQLIQSVPITVTVSAIETKVSFKTQIQGQISPGEGFIDQTLYPTVTTAGKGVKDYQSIFKIPEELTIESFSYAMDGRQYHNTTQVYYQYDSDTTDKWTLLPRTSGLETGVRFDNIPNKERIRRIKIHFFDRENSVPMYSPYVLRYSYKNAKINDKFTIINESNTFYDNNNNIEITIPVQDVISTVTDFKSDTPTLKDSYNDFGHFSKNFKNGETLVFRHDIESSKYVPFNAPYKFILLPPGVDLSSNVDAFLLPIGNNGANYPMNNSTHRVYPQVTPTNQSKKKLSDGSTLFFYKDKYPLVGMDSIYNYHWKSEYNFKLQTAYLGNHEVLIGTGSAVSDNYTNTGKVSLSDKEKGVSEEIRDYLTSQGVTSTQYVPYRNTIKVVEDNDLEIYSKVKLTTDDTYINVTDPSSLMEMVPGQAADYQVEIKNTGTTDMKNVSVMDILPYKNDTEILTNVSRDSAFRLFLTGEIKDVTKNGEKLAQSDYDLFYSKSKTPERWNKNGQVVAGDPWGSLPEKITDVQAFKIDLKKSLVPGDSIVLNFKLQVPADAPRSSDTQKYLAYNTIAYNSDKKTAESNRVRVQTKEPGALKISGRVFDDLSVDGLVGTDEPGFDSQTVMLYKKVGTNYQKVDERQTTENEGLSGFYTFNNELENGETYKIAIDLTELIEEGYTPSQIESQYASIVIDKTDKTIGWLVKNGQNEFIVSDKAIAGHALIYELNAPFYKATEVSAKILYEYSDGTPSNRKKLPSKGMELGLQKNDGTPVKDDKGNPVTAKVTEDGTVNFGKLPLATNTDYELIYPNSRAYKLTYKNEKNKAQVTYDKVVQSSAVFTKTVSDKGETAKFSFSGITPGSSINAIVFTTSYDVLRFGVVSETLTFGENGKLPLSVFNTQTSPNPFKLEVEDSRIVKEPKWKVTATIATDLQALENNKVVSKLPGALEYVQTKDGVTTAKTLTPGVPVAIKEVTGIKEDDADNVINIPDAWTNKSGIVLNIPSGIPELKTYSTDILWTLTQGPY